MRKTVKKQRSVPEAVRHETRIRKELALAAGSDFFQYRDPLYHVTENFQQTFDQIGRNHAASLRGEAAGQEARSAGETRPEDPQQRAPERKAPLRALPNTMIPLQQFSETAFQRGTLSTSILAGTGKMMLVSCLKRTIGQSGPKRIQQQTIFDTGSQRRNIPNRDPDQMIFNRTFTQGAVGLVVDTIRDARRVVQSMEDMARGTGELQGAESSTLREMYPFLDDSRERMLMEQYKAELAQTADEREQAVLQNALVRTRALLQKKKQMKIEFINKLRLISDRATEALEEFEEPGFVDEIAAVLEAPEEAPPAEEEPPPAEEEPPPAEEGPPPAAEGPPPDTGEDDDPDRPEDQQPEDLFGPEEPFGEGPEESGP